MFFADIGFSPGCGTTKQPNNDGMQNGKSSSTLHTEKDELFNIVVDRTEAQLGTSKDSPREKQLLETLVLDCYTWKRSY